MEQKQEKEETVPKQFDSFYSAVNAKMKTSNNKHVIDLILSSPTIRLSQSENIILDNRDIKESIVDFVCALKRQNTDFPDIYIPFWKQLKFHLNLLPTRMTKRKTEKLGSFLKSEKVSLNRLYSRGRAIFVRGVGLGLTHTENFMIKKLREVRETSGLELDQEEAEPTIGKNFKTGFEIPNENILIREHPYSENILITDSDFILSDRTSAILITADMSFNTRLETDFKKNIRTGRNGSASPISFTSSW